MKAWRRVLVAVLATLGLCIAPVAGAAGLTGVPGVMVQGRYLALTTGNYDELLANIDQLIGRVRAEAGRK